MMTIKRKWENKEEEYQEIEKQSETIKHYTNEKEKEKKDISNKINVSFNLT